MTKHAILAALALAASSVALAQEPVKIGVVAPFSGVAADYGKQMEAGMKAWMKLHGDTVNGRKIQLLIRDTTGPNPEIAKRLAQELVTRDKVDFLAGFGFTPEALAAAPIATESKTPMIVMNAASSVVTTRSPYIARFSMSLPQVSAPMATWAAKNGIKKVYTLVADYAPGLDSEKAFKDAFTAAGGTVVDSVRVPLRNPDFAPFVQRIKDAKPEAVFMFVPAGEQSIAFMKAFVKAFAEVGGDLKRPNFMAVGGYDGMAAIAEVVKKLGAKIDGDKAMEILKTLRMTSPRGPIAIDPATRDIVQTVYIRRVQKVGNDYYNVEFDKFPDVKDPGK